MCFTKKPKNEVAATTPAAAPAPALPPVEAPEVGEGRRKQSEALFGEEAPNYRVKRTTTQTPVNPNSPITM